MMVKSPVRNIEDGMDIKAAQQDVQTTFVRGSVGQAVSGTIWLVSAILGTFVNQRYAILLLVVGGHLSFH